MSNIINLPITSSAKIAVEVGDRITNKTTIAKPDVTHRTETIHLAKLLGVENSKISKYIKKKIGDKIAAGDVLAEKKGFLSSSRVRSPIEGKIAELDLTQGILSLEKYSEETKADLISPVSGKVVALGKSAIEIETDNPVFKGIKGKGDSVKGDLNYLDNDEVGILDYHGDIENSIVLCRGTAEATLIKFSVLGALGLIMQKVGIETVLPWVQVDEHIFTKLTHFAGKKIWLNPESKQIVIIDN